MRYSLAGHQMVLTAHGDVCEVCGRTWAQMLNEREYWKVGEPNIAQVSATSTNPK
jgi:hypothetical protein